MFPHLRKVRGGALTAQPSLPTVNGGDVGSPQHIAADLPDESIGNEETEETDMLDVLDPPSIEETDTEDAIPEQLFDEQEERAGIFQDTWKQLSDGMKRQIHKVKTLINGHDLEEEQTKVCHPCRGGLIVVPRAKLAKLTEELKSQLQKVQTLVHKSEEIEQMFLSEAANAQTEIKKDVSQTESKIEVPVEELHDSHEDDVPEEELHDSQEEEGAVVSKGWLSKLTGGLKKQMKKAKELLTGNEEIDGPDDSDSEIVSSTGETVREKPPVGVSEEEIVISRERLDKLAQALRSQVEKAKKLKSKTEEMEHFIHPENMRRLTDHELDEVRVAKKMVRDKEVDRPDSLESLDDDPLEHIHLTEDVEGAAHTEKPPQKKRIIPPHKKTPMTEEMRRKLQKDKTPTRKMGKGKTPISRTIKAKDLISQTEEIDSSVPDRVVESTVSETDEAPPVFQKPLHKKKDEQAHQLKVIKPEWPAGLKLLHDRQGSDTINQDYHLVTLTVDKDWKPRIMRQPIIVQEPECTPSEHDADMLIIDCATCTVRPNMYKPGVFVVCYNCQRMQGDGTCKIDQKESMFRISTSYFYPTTFTA